MKPMQGLFGEIASGRLFCIFPRSTIGLLLEIKIFSSSLDTSQNFLIVSISAAIRAKGLLLFLFFNLNLFTACSFVASQAIWNPPNPLIATIAPCFKSLIVSFIGFFLSLIFNFSVDNPPIPPLVKGGEGGLFLLSFVLLCNTFISLLTINFTCGPQTGHAFGWAWNLLSSGLWYSFSQSGHILNTDMVVFGLS